MAGFAMNDRAPHRFHRPLAAALALALAACSAGAPQAEPPLKGARIGGAFTLTDQNGRRVSDRDFAGQWRMVYFGYTFCPDVCPTDVQTMMRAREAFLKDHPQAKLAAIFISVDPARDTPAALGQFAGAFPRGLVALTGTPAEIADVAKRYGIYYHRAEGETATKDAYLVDHSRQTVLFDPGGAPVALIPTDQGAQASIAELDKWVR